MTFDSFVESLQISKHDFTKESVKRLEDNLWVKNLWPLVYIISDEDLSEAYVGESTDAYKRLHNHLANEQRNKLKNLHIITSSKFNKSAALDIESNLISYMTGDGKYVLQNGNAGLANHNYYQKEEYYRLFNYIWSELKEDNVTIKSLKEIDNSDLFKYSPYKSLSPEQYESIREIIEIVTYGTSDSVFVKGSAGTGKTILAIFLIKLLVTKIDNLFEFDESENPDEINLVAALKKKYPNPKVALVVPMTSLRNTLKSVFRKIGGLKADMVIGPTGLAKKEYDIVLVDEAHRLKRRKNLTGYKAFDDANKALGFSQEGTQLDWVIKQSTHQILFYDPKQSIKPTDIPKENFDKIASQAKVVELTSQMRVKGGNDYISFVDRLLNGTLDRTIEKYASDNYDLLLFDSIDNFVDEIKQREEDHGLSRLIAGFSWPWVSSKDPNHKDYQEYDINIEGKNLRWNTEASNWINSKKASEEVGCIHTTQGYDLNFSGIIFGNEISYDPIKKELFVIPENYHDKKGKSGVSDVAVLQEYIINIYKTLMYRGIRGTYIYACDKNLRDYLKSFINSFIPEPQVKILTLDQVKPYETAVPLYDIYAAAGDFSELQGSESEMYSEFDSWIELPHPFKASKDYFVCEIRGESMNKIIPNGSLCLFKKYSGGSRNGKIVLAKQMDIQDLDFGSGLTVKEYHSEKRAEEGSWRHEKIVLRPKSLDDKYSEIELTEHQLSDFEVVGLFVCVL